MKKLNRTTIRMNRRSQELLALLRDRLGISDRRNLVNYCISRVAEREGVELPQRQLQTPASRWCPQDSLGGGW